MSALRDGVLASNSAYGAPGDRQGWPDFAAPDDRLTEFDAATGKVTAFRGTSSAAPVVSHQVVALTAFCLTLDAMMAQEDGPSVGNPRVGWAVVDRDSDPTKLPVPEWPFGALPHLGVDPNAARQLAKACRAAGVRPRAIPTTAIVTRLLRASARPVDGHTSAQVGYGEISYGTTAIFLARLTVGQMLELLAPRRAATDAALSRRVRSMSLIDEYLASSLEIWHANTVVWSWGFRRPKNLWGMSFIRPGSKEPI